MPNSEKDPHYFGSIEHNPTEEYKPSDNEVSIAKFKPSSVDKLQDIDDNHELRVAKMHGKNADGSEEERIVVYISDRSRPHIDERNLDSDEYAEYIELNRVAVAREGTGVYDKLKTALNMSHLEMKPNAKGEWMLVASTEDSTANLRDELLGTNLAEKTRQKLSPEGQDELDKVAEALKNRLSEAGEKFRNRAKWVARGGPVMGTNYYNRAKLEDLSNDEVKAIAESWVDLYKYGTPPEENKSIWKSDSLQLNEDTVVHNELYVVDFSKMKDPNLKKAILAEAETLWEQKKLNTREFYTPPTVEEEAKNKNEWMEKRLHDVEGRIDEQRAIIEAQNKQIEAFLEILDTIQIAAEREKIQNAIERAKQLHEMTIELEKSTQVINTLVKIAEKSAHSEPTAPKTSSTTPTAPAEVSKEVRDRIAEADAERAKDALNWDAIIVNNAKVGRENDMTPEAILQVTLQFMKSKNVENLNEEHVKQVLYDALGIKTEVSPENAPAAVKPEKDKKVEQRQPVNRDQVLGNIAISITETLQNPQATKRELRQAAQIAAEKYRSVADIDQAELDQMVDRAVDALRSRMVKTNAAEAPEEKHNDTQATNSNTVSRTKIRPEGKGIGKASNAEASSSSKVEITDEKSFVSAFEQTVVEMANGGMDPETIQAFMDTALKESGKTAEELGINMQKMNEVIQHSPHSLKKKATPKVVSE